MISLKDLLANLKFLLRSDNVQLALIYCYVMDMLDYFKSDCIVTPKYLHELSLVRDVLWSW